MESRSLPHPSPPGLPYDDIGRGLVGRGDGMGVMPCRDHGRHDLLRFEEIVNLLGRPEVLPDVSTMAPPPPGERSVGTYVQDMGRGRDRARKSRRGSEAGRPEKGKRDFFRPPPVELERKKGTR
jgi:hypothetical protein